MKIDYAVISEMGCRSNNKDSFKVIEKPDESRWLGVVCNGMIGHAMGEVASKWYVMLFVTIGYASTMKIQ